MPHLSCMIRIHISNESHSCLASLRTIVRLPCPHTSISHRRDVHQHLRLGRHPPTTLSVLHQHLGLVLSERNALVVRIFAEATAMLGRTHTTTLQTLYLPVINEEPLHEYLTIGELEGDVLILARDISAVLSYASAIRNRADAVGA